MNSEIVNGFSIDVEDWYQVSDFEDKIPLEDWDNFESRVVPNTRKILRMLEEFDVKATFFILTWNALRHPELVHEIAEAGHEIATHGHTHRLHGHTHHHHDRILHRRHDRIRLLRLVQIHHRRRSLADHRRDRRRQGRGHHRQEIGHSRRQ